MDKTAQTLTLRNERTLGYAEWGDLEGKPIFLLGGSSSSRLLRHSDESMVTSLGIHLYTFDRPGTGLSDRQRGRTLLDWVDDVRDFANQRGIDRFAVIGGSLGGSYALACAYGLRDLLVCASVVSGVAGLDDADVFDTQNSATKSMVFLGQRLPGLMTFQNNLMRPLINSRFGQPMLRSALGGLADSDQTILDTPGEMEIMIESVRECMRQGGAGSTDDVRAVVLDWGFRLEDIQTKVFIWQGEDDPQATPAMAKYMSDRIPNSECTFVSGAGHLLIISHWRDILTQIVDYWNID